MTLDNLHLAIIMDGNGRWAQQRGWPRTAGHRAGARAVRRVVEGAARMGVGALTLYAFSSDNWTRPSGEVRNLMRLLKRYLIGETSRCQRNGIRLAVIGRRDRLAPDLIDVIEQVEAQTADADGMLLRLAVDYSATRAIVRTARALRGKIPTREDFAQALCAAIHSPNRLRRVDLLVRTGGEQRLSDFLLWECAYAELVFTQTLWPDFEVADLQSAIARFCSRERRFGGLGG